MNEIRSTGTIRQVSELVNSGVFPVTSGHMPTDFVESVEAVLSGDGVTAATVELEYSDNMSTWVNAGTVNLSDTTTKSDDFGISRGAGRFFRARLTAISGSGARVVINAISVKNVTFRVPLEYLITD